jgi:hypothetical protein
MRRLLVLSLLLITFDANAAAVTGWVGIPLIADDGAGGGPTTVPVPNVVGQDLATADATLEGEGLDTGEVTMTCSAEAENEVLSQSPLAGAMVAIGSDVDLVASNEVECINGTRRNGIRLGIGL